MLVAFQNVHGPLEAPTRFMDRFSSSTGGNVTRQALCALAEHMDEAVGNITNALIRKGLFDSTLIVFSSDNGGPSNMQGGNWASNYPLRGGKGMLFEGGIRVPAFIRGAGIPKSRIGSASDIYFAGVDWTPTVVRAATGEHWTKYLPVGQEELKEGDGMDLWLALTATRQEVEDEEKRGRSVSRNYFLLETHPPDDPNTIHGFGLIVDHWKLVNLHHTFHQMVGDNSWLPPPGQDVESVSFSVHCGAPAPPGPIDPLECVRSWCLFDLKSDPCEYRNVITLYPDVADRLKRRLVEFSETAVPPVAGEGCEPIKIARAGGGAVPFAWAPCDLPPHSNGNGGDSFQECSDTSSASCSGFS